MVPWRGRAVFGTWESPTTTTAADVAVTRDEVASFIGQLNDAYADLNLTHDEVSLVHRGVVPAVVRGSRVALEGHERVRDHRSDGIIGLVSVAGTKYTTARATAQRIVDAICAMLGRAARPSRSATTSLPWSPLRGDELLAHAAREEMVVTLADAVTRRTGLGGTGYPGDAVATRAAAVVGRELGWSDEQQRAEISALRTLY
jgi:glycerol-3-phosphate dehydrogenase